MATLEELYYSKRKYDDLKRKLNNVIGYLDKSISCSNEAKTLFEGTFKIDDESAGKKEINNLNSRLISVRDTLNNKVYPRVVSELKRIQSEISEQEIISEQE